MVVHAMKIYGLIVIGPMKYFNGRNKMFSKKIFRSREKAEAYKPEFVAKCLEDRGGMNEIAAIDEAFIIELELDSENDA